MHQVIFKDQVLVSAPKKAIVSYSNIMHQVFEKKKQEHSIPNPLSVLPSIEIPIKVGVNNQNCHH
jgi:hypothetical protein